MNNNECNGVEKYRAVHPTRIRPYDIEGRNEYFRVHRTFQLEQESFQKLDAIRGTLNEKHKTLYDELIKLNEKLWPVGQMTLREINQKNIDDLVEKRQTHLYKALLPVFIEQEDLKPYSNFHKENGDFWDRRNKTMTRNILTYVNDPSFKNKTIVVLTGFYHRYYLLNELAAKESSGNFKIGN